jgi:hypothetical protein
MMGASDMYSDADLERELQLLAEEEINEDMTQIKPLPDVPQSSKTIEVNHRPSADPLKELAAWAQ